MVVTPGTIFTLSRKGSNSIIGERIATSCARVGDALTDYEALDIAAYVNAQPRPKFVLKEHLAPAARRRIDNSAIKSGIKDGLAPPRC